MLSLSAIQASNIKGILKANGIDSHRQIFERNGIEVRVLDIEDFPDFDILPHLKEAHDFISRFLEKGQGVLVVCSAGISRSASIVISFLMLNKKMSY